MSRVERTISTSESDIKTSPEVREEIHYIKEIECEKRIEQTKPKVRSKSLTKRRINYWMRNPINRENKVVEWLQDNSEYHVVQEPYLDVEQEIIQPDGTIYQQNEIKCDWLNGVLSKTKRIKIEQPKPIRFIPGINDEVIQTEYEMIPKRSENVTLEMQLRNKRPEMDEDEEIKYEIVSPKPDDLSRIMNQKKKK